ncbi:MAG TPA: type II secretion system protein GspJ, partial [Chloroflexota bacterium]|nr:type II secretion system protein GspJ [Chloroflexota bacterium]
RLRVDERIAASAAARQGIEAVVAAVRNVRRDPDNERRLILGEPADGGNSRIEMQVISDVSARRDSPESDQYEVGFCIWQREDGVPVLLCRRNNGLAEKPGHGGMATVMAEGVVGFVLEYYSQGQWQNEWAEAEVGLPEAVRVTVAATGVARDGHGAAKVAPVMLSTIIPIHAEMPVDIGQDDARQKDQGGSGKSSSQGPSERTNGSNRRGQTGGSR